MASVARSNHDSARTLRALLLVVAGCAICGCSSNQGTNQCGRVGAVYERAPVAKTSSYVYVYWPCEDSFWGGIQEGYMKCADDSANVLKGAYHRFSVKPGPVECSATYYGASPVQIDAKPGRDYYVRVDRKILTLSLALVDPEAAQVGIAECKRDR